MRDNAELNQTIRELRDNNVIYHFSRDYLRNVMHDAADAIEELLARDVVPTDFHERCLQLEIRKRIELEKQMPHWISVEDELPKNAGQMCLVCAKNSFGQQSVFNAFTGYGDFNWYTYDTTKTRSRLDNNNAIALGWEITHWMPLPAPPKGVE